MLIPGSLDVLETCLYIDDLDAAQHFYGDVLGLEFVSRQDARHVFFRTGRGMLLLFRPDASDDPNSEVPRHGARGAGHVAFAVAARQLDAWRAHLQACGVAIEQAVEWPHGGRSIYFRDPAGNSLELATPQLWGAA